jgi:hypothetical protein
MVREVLAKTHLIGFSLKTGQASRCHTGRWRSDQGARSDVKGDWV